VGLGPLILGLEFSPETQYSRFWNLGNRNLFHQSLA
jgi:hypothetical protein